MSAAALVSTLLLASCTGPVSQASNTSTPDQSSQTSPSPAPSAVSNRPVTLVVFDENSSDPTLHFLTEAGAESGHLVLAARTQVLAVGGRRIFVATPVGVLQAILRDGTAVTLDSSIAQGFGQSVVIARDDAHWTWATNTQGNGPVQTTIKVASEGSAPRVVLTQTNPKGSLQPFAWTPSGIYVNPLPMDANGYFPFQPPVIIGLMALLNPTTGATKPVPTGDCTFSDVSDAGVIACYPAGPKPTLRLFYSPGNVIDLTLATPRFNFVGDAYFSRDSTMLTVAGATGVGMPAELSGGVQPKPEAYGVDLVRVQDGSIRRFGPSGTRVAMGEESWLPDGNLVLWRPPRAAGGAAGLYVLDPSGFGQGTLIPTTGRPVGYLVGP
jgi:hypothetical protein